MNSTEPLEILLNPNDVLCGRGSGPNDYSGNINFRALVLERRDEYLSTSNRASKAKIAKEIVGHVHNLKPPGRFLEQHGKTWRVVSEEKALEKAKQALRQNRHRRSTSGTYSCSSQDSSRHHVRSSSFQSHPNVHRVGHVRSSSFTPSNHQGVGQFAYHPPPPPTSMNQHRRHRSDQYFDCAPPPRQPPHHHRSFSDRGHYDNYNFYNQQQHHQPYHYQPQPHYNRDRENRKYFNRSSTQPPPILLRESLEEDIEMEEVLSSANNAIDSIQFPETDFFDSAVAVPVPTSSNGNVRTRNLSADSDISAISLGNDDPLSISDFVEIQPIPNKLQDSSHGGDSINDFNNFDMSYYMLQTLADDSIDL